MTVIFKNMGSVVIASLLNSASNKTMIESLAPPEITYQLSDSVKEFFKFVLKFNKKYKVTWGDLLDKMPQQQNLNITKKNNKYTYHINKFKYHVMNNVILLKLEISIKRKPAFGIRPSHRVCAFQGTLALGKNDELINFY